MKASALGNNAASQGADTLQSILNQAILDADRHIGDPQQAPAGTSGTSGSGEATPVSTPPSMSISPDALMAYCESRLNSLDTQMTQIFDQQQTNASLTQDIDAIASALNESSAAPGSSSSNPNPDMTLNPITVEMAYNTAIHDAKSAGNTTLANELTQDLSMFTGTSSINNNPPTISSNTLSGLQQSLKNYGNELNSNSEMSMITLQSLMSQRQTAIQLTTNLVQSLGDQASSIAKNIGQ